MSFEDTNNRQVSLTSTTTEIVVMDLLPYTEYSFRVAAVTVAEGPYTAELVARTAEDGMERLLKCLLTSSSCTYTLASL